MGKITRVGVDIAKSIFYVHAVDKASKLQWKGKYSRSKWLAAIVAKVPTGAEIAMEACGSAHHWARELQKLGYKVKLIHAQFVKPYVKSIRQQDVQAAHRIRDKLLAQRTAKANQIRGLTSEYGLVAPLGIKKLRLAIPMWLE